MMTCKQKRENDMAETNGAFTMRCMTGVLLAGDRGTKGSRFMLRTMMIDLTSESLRGYEIGGSSDH